MSTFKRITVFGLSGQLGDALLGPLLDRRVEIRAITRQPRAQRPGLEWMLASLEAMPALAAEDLETIVSLGPLDAFADWFASVLPVGSRVVAIGSAGRNDKFDSTDPAERATAMRLRDAEERLFSAAAACGAVPTVLRPTLLYGNGRDLSLSRLVAVARRWRLLPLPASATGLRQPVHVADVADAVMRCLDRPASTAGHGFDLPGGEQLSFRAMVARALASQVPHARVVQLPNWVFRLGFAGARILGRRAAGLGLLERLRRDQTADFSPAQAAFGYAPRRFDP